MPRVSPPTLAVSLVCASMSGLLACPQLRSDDFDSIGDPGADTCARQLTCAPGGGGSGSEGGAAPGSAGTAAGGSAQNAGSAGAESGAGSSGEAGSAGTGGSGESPDAGVDPSDTSPDCWSVQLQDSTHVASGNCLGINGWNAVETDPATPDTHVSTSYEDDGVCFTGTIVNQGWGAVYNLTLNDTDPWNAAAAGVGGFELELAGASLPPEIKVVYTDDDAGDFCRVVTPAEAVVVPFASAHPGCSTSSSSVTDGVDLTYIRLAFVPTASDYAMDFCLNLRAIY